MLKRKLFCLLFVGLFCLSGVFASEDLSDQNLTQKLGEQVNFLDNSKNETIFSNQNSQTQEILSSEQMPPPLSAREYLTNARTELEMLRTALTESNSGLESMKKQLNDCLENLSNCEKALQSNREDTSAVLEELGIIYSEYQNLEKKLKNAFIIGNVIIPVTTIPLIIGGTILSAVNNDLGKPMLYGGLGIFFACEIVWNGGHFILRIL